MLTESWIDGGNLELEASTSGAARSAGVRFDAR